MFEIKCDKDKLICTLNEKPETHKLLKPTEMSCEIVLRLGVEPSVSTKKILVAGMDKTFNALVKQKSGNFLKDMKNKVRALGEVTEKAIREAGQSAAEASQFLTQEEKDLKQLWTKWSTQIAPKLAAEALQAVAKSAKDKALEGMGSQKVKAVGRVIAVPILSLAAAAASGLTGNPVGMGSAGLKGLSALMKASEDLSKALNGFRSDQAAIAKDINALSDVLKTIANRINSMDKQRQVAELDIAELKAQKRIVVQELAARKGNREAGEFLKAQKLIAPFEQTIKELAEGLPNTQPLKESWKKIAAEHKKMLDAAGVAGADTPKSLRNARDLTDASKEALSILSKVT